MSHDYGDDARFEDLFAGIPPRQRPDADVTEHLERELRAQWRDLVRARRRARMVRTAVAAAIIVAAGIGLWRGLLETPLVDVAVATVDRSAGGAIRWHSRARDILRDVKADAVIMTGHTVTTGDASRVALRWHRLGSLRVDERSQVSFAGEDAIELISGSVYYDSDGARPGALTVRTPVGAILHSGTQYMATLEGGRLRVAVREGTVSVRDGDRSHRIGAGEAVTLNAFGAQGREPIASFDPAWAWVQAIAPFDVPDGASVEAVLRWVARERGLRVVYAGAATERAALDTEVSGLAGVEPAEALVAMGLMTDLSFSVRDGMIVVETQE